MPEFPFGSRPHPLAASLAEARPWLALPKDRRPEATLPAPPLDFHETLLPPDLLPPLHALAARLELSPHELLLAAFLVQLARHASETDLALVWRARPSAASPLLLPLRVLLDFHAPLGPLLDPLRRQSRSVPPLTHADLAQLLPPDARHPGHPDLLFPVTFAVDAPDPTPGSALLDLNLRFPETPSDDHPARLRLGFAPLYFQADGMRWFARHFIQLLRSLVTQPDRPILDLELTDADERRWLLEGGRGKPATDQPNFPHRRLETLARDRPDDLALVDGPTRLSFAELDRHANQLAHHLLRVGLRPGQVVALLLPRSHLLVAAVFAVFKAGGTLLIVDPHSPVARRRAILTTARPDVVVTPSLDHPAEDDGIGVRLGLAESAEERSRHPATSPSDPAQDHPDRVACLFLTSGTTGTPKLVQDPFGWVRAPSPFAPGDRLLCKSESGTTFTVAEALYPSWGVPVFILPEGVEKDLPRLAAFIRRHEISRALLIPSTLQALLEIDDFVQASALHSVFCIGEALPPAVKRRFHERRPRTRLIVSYGCTEARSCLSRVATPDDDPHVVDAGRPTPGMQVHILDSAHRPCPVGVPGELHVGGQIALGYLGDPASTATRFVPHPFDPAPGSRLFATRDLARSLPDGCVEILGRLDRQVKIRGHRVELEAIETVLGGMPECRRVAVVAPEDPTGSRTLVAFLAPADPGCPPEQLVLAARRFLRERLPAHQVPSRIIVTPDLPLTATGKIDQAALLARLHVPAPEASRAPKALPRTDLERELVDVWEAVLGHRPIGIHESFFDIGGNSLSAVRLMYEVRRRLNRPLSMVQLANHPTIAQLASALPPSDAAEPASRIHGNGTGPVLHFIPGIPGVNYLPDALRERVGAAGRFCDALQFPGLAPGEAPLDDVSLLAREMIRRTREIDPEGPVALAGYSLGGVVAFEMARQLQEAGHPPRLVLLYDAFAPGGIVRRGPTAVIGVVSRALLRNGPRGTIGFYARRLRERAHDRRNRELGPLAVVPTDTSPESLARKAVYDASFRAGRTLRPGTPYRGRVVLLRAADRDMSFGTFRGLLPDNGWSPFLDAPPIIEDIPCDHWQILQSPIHASLVAERTAYWLSQA